MPWKKLTIEIDIYRGSNEGLMVAEVEFPDVQTYHSFHPPDWLGDEVTGASRYSNVDWRAIKSAPNPKLSVANRVRHNLFSTAR